MKNLQNNEGTTRRMRAAVIILALLTTSAVTITGYHLLQSGELRKANKNGRLEQERTLAEKLQLEKRMSEMGTAMATLDNDKHQAEERIAELQRRAEQAQARARSLEGKAGALDKARRELADAQAAKERLERELATMRDSDRTLRDQLAQARNDRDAAAARFDQQQQGAQMVNNAEVDALRGKKERLTVVAKRTREIRMAFDLPQHMAQQANFKIVTPKGKAYEGQDPSIAMTFDQPEAEPLAAVSMTEGHAAGARASRVHLKFSPKDKLEPGLYRIDVRSGDTYLNTVLLRLR